PRLVASDSIDQVTGCPITSAMIWVQARECPSAAPEATIVWPLVAQGASKPYTAASRSATDSRAARTISTLFVSRRRPAIAPRRGSQARPSTCPRGAQTAARIVAVAEGKEAVLVDLGRGQGLDVPPDGTLIEESSSRRHRDARGCPAEQAEVEEFPERAPARHPAAIGRALAREPP